MASSCTSDIRPIATFARWVTQAAPRTIQWLVALFFVYVMATILSLVSLVPVLALSGIVGVDKRPGSAGAMLSHWLSYLGNAAVPLALGRYFFIPRPRPPRTILWRCEHASSAKHACSTCGKTPTAHCSIRAGKSRSGYPMRTPYAS